MIVRRKPHTIGLIGRDRHLFFFRPSAPGGNSSGWGFHHRRRRNGIWSHTILKLHVKPKAKHRIPGLRGWRSYEITRWRSRNATNTAKRAGNRLTYKSYVRLKVCPGGSREPGR